MASQKLFGLLKSPSKVASALNWKKRGTVMSLDIHKDRIGVAVANHPSLGNKVQTMEPIVLPTCRGHNVNDETVEQLATIADDHNVCGVIVSWPLQQDTGKVGAACGRVLHTLEELLVQDSNAVITPNRPLCLWDGVHPEEDREDEWGRCASYCKTTKKQVHIASEEQYNQDEKENVLAAQVWEDFSRVHWPEFEQDQSEDLRVSDHEEQSFATSVCSSKLVLAAHKGQRDSTRDVVEALA